MKSLTDCSVCLSMMGVQQEIQNMQDVIIQTLQNLESRPREWDIFDFFGTRIVTIASHQYKITSEAYIHKLKPFSPDASFELFRSYRVVFAWVGYTGPDDLCAINKAA